MLALRLVSSILEKRRAAKLEDRRLEVLLAALAAESLAPWRLRARQGKPCPQFECFECFERERKQKPSHSSEAHPY